MAYEDWQYVDGGPDGGSYVDSGTPARLVLHATQSPNISAALSAYRAKGVPPHATLDPWRQIANRHISLSRSAYALENDAGGVETNRQWRTFQVEIVGYSEDPSNLPENRRAYALALLSDPQKKWLGERLREMMDPAGIPAVFPKFYGQGAGFTLASETAPQRMSYDAWRRFSGVCGHQHVPENAHWDPGPIDIATIMRYAYPAQISEDIFVDTTVTPTWAPPKGSSYPGTPGEFGHYRLVCNDSTAPYEAIVLAYPGVPLVGGTLLAGWRRGDVFGIPALFIAGLSARPTGIGEGPGGKIIVTAEDGGTFAVGLRP